MTFDTLSSARRLREKGFTQESEANMFKSELRNDIALLEQRIIIKIGAMMFAGFGLLAAFQFFQ